MKKEAMDVNLPVAQMVQAWDQRYVIMQQKPTSLGSLEDAVVLAEIIINEPRSEISNVSDTEFDIGTENKKKKKSQTKEIANITKTESSGRPRYKSEPSNANRYGSGRIFQHSSSSADNVNRYDNGRFSYQPNFQPRHGQRPTFNQFQRGN